MAKFTGLFGVFALILAVMDSILGRHNGDVRRVIHLPEFLFFFGFLSLLEIWAFTTIIKETNVNRWLLVFGFSFFSSVLGIILFGLATGSSHRDGGPIALSFELLSTIGGLVLPISLIGFVAVAVSNKRKGISIITHR